MEAGQEEQNQQSLEEEQQQAQELRRQRLASRFDRRLQAGGRMLSRLGRQRGSRTMQRLGKSFQRLGKEGADIKAQQHSGGAWLVALLLAIAKDLLDVGTLQFGMIFNFFVNALAAVVFFVMFRRSVSVTRRLLSVLFSFIGESVPILGFLPLWTLSVLYLYMKASNWF